jgi:hypothetical protein
MASIDELATWGRAYAAAFSSGHTDKVLPFYKPNGYVTFHQLGGDRTGKGGAGKDITAYTGSALGALVRGKLPARLMLWAVFRRLAKQGYDHSLLTVHGMRAAPVSRTIDVLFTFERVDKAGSVFESSAAVYRLEGEQTSWVIAEVWLFDSIASAPASVEVASFRAT